MVLYATTRKQAMQTSTHFNTDPFALESDFDAKALTEFDAERTDFERPLEVTPGGSFEAESKADNRGRRLVSPKGENTAPPAQRYWHSRTASRR